MSKKYLQQEIIDFNIKKNYLFNLLNELFIILIPFVSAPYVSRLFGPYGSGIKSFTYSVISFFLLFESLGINAYTRKEISSNLYNKKFISQFFSEIFLIKFFTFILTICIYLLFCFFSHDYKKYFLFQSPYIVSELFNFSCFFQGKWKYKTLTIRNISVRLLGLLFLFCFITNQNDLLLYLFLLSILELLANILLFYKLLHEITWTPVHWNSIKKHFYKIIIYFIPIITVSIYTLLNKILLGIMCSKNESGYYEYATMIINILKNVILSLNIVVANKMNIFIKENLYDNIQQLFITAMHYIIMLAFPASFGLIIIAPQFIPLYLGKEYIPVIPLIYILSPLIILIGISNGIAEQWLIPIGKIKEINIITLKGAIINFLLNLLLIPRLASIGTALSLLFSEFIITILYLMICSKYISLSRFFKGCYKYIISSIVMSLFLLLTTHYLDNSLLELFIPIISSMFLYFLTLFLLREVFFLNILTSITNLIHKKKGTK